MVARQTVRHAAELAEKIEVILAAQATNPALYKELVEYALDAQRSTDKVLCERVSELLIRRGIDQPGTFDLLRERVLANNQAPPNTRQRAAYVIYANAPESEIAVLASQATVEADRDVQLAALRGLARHKSPAARIALEGVARTYPGDRGIQAILREMNAPPPVAEEDE